MIRRINGEQSPECGLFHERLELEVDWIEASCKIDAAQRNKLRIAGRGDIKRFFDRMSDLKRRYRQVKGKPAEARAIAAGTLCDKKGHERQSVRRDLVILQDAARGALERATGSARKGPGRCEGLPAAGGCRAGRPAL